MRCCSGLNDAKCSVLLEARRKGPCQFMFTQAHRKAKKKKKSFKGQKLSEQADKRGAASDKEVIAALGTSGERRHNNKGEKLFSFVIEGEKRRRVGFLVEENTTGRTHRLPLGAPPPPYPPRSR